MTDIYVKDNTLIIRDKAYKCAFGKAGFSADKKEGDNCTPYGSFAMRRVFYRADKIKNPAVHLHPIAISPDMGWSDDSNCDSYNTLIKFPYNPSAEKIYRDDDVYDVVVELGYNDDPPIAGRGSAIFFHIAKEGYAGTEGCIAVSLEDMTSILSLITSDSVMHIQPS